jgi:hypothetical protein
MVAGGLVPLAGFAHGLDDGVVDGGACGECPGDRIEVVTRHARLP